MSECFLLVVDCRCGVISCPCTLLSSGLCTWYARKSYEMRYGV